ncbi:hypothetical protein [Schlesneria paludicola]|uniref:hypothetical protein n=1 Tax=Schlesneria paludicola TaxID=360056 RepID=UPI0012F88F3A|nr:hypothetical protein [Schlesneria paludicola]
MNAITRMTFRTTLAVVIFLALELFGFVGIHEIRVVNNNPFTNPATVFRIADHQIEFADGRILKLEYPLDAEFQTMIKNSENEVGLEPASPESQSIMLCVRRLETNCQLGRPSLVLPLIVHDRPKFAKKFIAWGNLETQQ